MNARIWWTAGVLISLVGCVQLPQRQQSAEQIERARDMDVRVVGDVAEVAKTDFWQLSGVGLVTGLDGTGGSPARGYFRELLEKELLNQKIPNVKSVLEDRNNALVLVSTLVPPGLRKGESLDLEITLPRESRATSLRGGYLQNCTLRNWAMNHDQSDLLKGHVLARAHGPLLVGLEEPRRLTPGDLACTGVPQSRLGPGNPGEAVELRRARIWEGGTYLIDQPFSLRLKKGNASLPAANAVAQRLNDLFAEDVRPPSRQDQEMLQLLDNVTQQLNRKFDDKDLARAFSNDVILLNVPFAYRLNPDRYLRVALVVPLRDVPEQRNRYLQRLAKMLLDPHDTIKAALRLEALGNDSVPALKHGLESPQPLVRFAAAESLTYLGFTAGIEELARLAQKPGRSSQQANPLRGPCLLALANLDGHQTRARLTELLEQPDPELRYGAFLALRLLSNTTLKSWEQALAQNDPRALEILAGGDQSRRLGGEMLNRSCWLHVIAPKSPAMIHVSLKKRAEIVLFGSDIRLLTPVRLLAGADFTVTAEKRDDRCTVTRISARAGNKQCLCSLQIADVLRSMGELGAGYPALVDFLRKADERHCLSCALHIDAVPESISIDELAKRGRDPNFLSD